MTAAYIYLPNTPGGSQGTATFQSGVVIQNQPYGAQRITTNFIPIPSGTMITPTAPPQYLIATNNGNLAFDGTMFLQSSGAAGMHVVVGVPSGAQMIVAFSGVEGATGAGDCFNITSAALCSTGVGTGVYAGLNQTPVGVSFSGSLVCAAGVTGPAVITALGNSNHTGTILAGSNIFLYPST